MGRGGDIGVPIWWGYRGSIGHARWATWVLHPYYPWGVR